jgi:hypothetical protein
MIQLYHGSGAGDFTIVQNGLTHDECRVLFENAARVLGARSQTRAAEILRSVPFWVADATNRLVCVHVCGRFQRVAYTGEYHGPPQFCRGFRLRNWLQPAVRLSLR